MNKTDETEKPVYGQRAIDNERWREANRRAIDAYNRMIEEDGFVFSDGVRTF
jgi:hypothetical protein